MRKQVLGTVCVAACAVLATVTGGTAVASIGPSASSPLLLPPPPVEKVVEIDGRFVKVSLSVMRVIPGAPLPEGNKPTVTARVQISIQDGATLPEGLRATHVRFERPQSAQRFFNARLTEVETESGEFELDIRGYRSDISARAPHARKLKATVRLVIGDRVIRVPMGTVPVAALPLP